MSLLDNSITLQQVLNIFFDTYLKEEETKLIEEYLHENPNLLSTLITFLDNKEEMYKVKSFIDKLLEKSANTINYTLARAYREENIPEPVVISIKPYGAHQLKVRYLRNVDWNEVEEKVFDIPHEHIGSSVSEPYILSINKE